jgi:hypothetical protein
VRLVPRGTRPTSRMWQQPEQQIVRPYKDR